MPQGLKSVRENYSFASLGLAHLRLLLTHGSRRGLHSYAVSRLKSEVLFHRAVETLVLPHTLKPSKMSLQTYQIYRTDRNTQLIR